MTVRSAGALDANGAATDGIAALAETKAASPRAIMQLFVPVIVNLLHESFRTDFSRFGRIARQNLAERSWQCFFGCAVLVHSFSMNRPWLERSWAAGSGGTSVAHV
jgi:hypothetical protein